MKKETLEEFINSQPYYGHGTPEYLEGIEVGAKWQAERMYSEEEVLEHLNILIMMPSTKLDEFTDDKEMVTIKWFENSKY